MAQFKIYGFSSFLSGNTAQLSDAIHRASTAGLGLPEEKRFHRFLPLEEWQFFAPSDRSEQYLIIEVSMFEGRPLETKKHFYVRLTEELGREGVSAQDIEVTLTETPRHNWLIRGLPADELELTYRVDHCNERTDD